MRSNNKPCGEPCLRRGERLRRRLRRSHGSRAGLGTTRRRHREHVLRRAERRARGQRAPDRCGCPRQCALLALLHGRDGGLQASATMRDDS